MIFITGKWEYRKSEERNGQYEAVKEESPAFKKTLFRAQMNLVDYPGKAKQFNKRR